MAMASKDAAILIISKLISLILAFLLICRHMYNCLLVISIQLSHKHFKLVLIFQIIFSDVAYLMVPTFTVTKLSRSPLSYPFNHQILPFPSLKSTSTNILLLPPTPSTSLPLLPSLLFFINIAPALVQVSSILSKNHHNCF